MTKENILTDEEHARISDAIRRAEQRTSGEIHCVLARASDSYFYPAALFVALFILVASLPAGLALRHWWIDVAPAGIAAAQLAAVAAALAVLEVVPQLRIHLVPRSLRYRRAHEHAVAQFLSRNIHMTRKRTGVLIFVSLAERYAEIIADTGINTRVPQRRWNETVEGLTRRAKHGDLAEGFVEAVTLVGAELAAHFPPEEENPDEVDNHLAEI